ncbi:MAG: hypothetical protein RBU25_00915 [Lentisphaeria bacterium]|jgi:hypothetical protein|nr:hypothetical protein [Lentisphaeria bacterium]
MKTAVLLSFLLLLGMLRADPSPWVREFRAAAPGPERVLALWDQFPVETDWWLRDSGGDSATVPAVLAERALAELAAGGEFLAAEDPLERYLAIARARRRERLAALETACPVFVFTKHYDLGGSHYAYTEGLSDAQSERHFKPGSALMLARIEGGEVKLETLIDDPQGVIRDPEVSFDGKRLLFAWKKSDRQDDYHLYEMDLPSREVRQLTHGLGYADYEPAYLPDGNIVFSSTRCIQTVDCYWTEVSNLFLCAADGSRIRRIGYDQVHTNYPTVLPDGRFLYTRWDYNDRDQIFTQPLFVMNADGTGQTEMYANNSTFPTSILHARGIPGTGRIVGILSGHHCDQRGKLALIDPGVSRQDAAGITMLAPVRPAKTARVDAYGQDGEQFQYPYPLNEREFLVAYSPHAENRNHRLVRPFGLYYLRADGQRELLAWDAKVSCNQPVPVRPRPLPPVRPSLVDYRREAGTFYMQDIHAGPGLAGIPRGTVGRLRVVALRYRAASVGFNRNGTHSMTPVATGFGSWDVKDVLGETPVQADGSACFTVPARTPVYFQAVDREGNVVQTMRSWSTLQPGEVFSCVGCHEPKNAAPPKIAGVTAAMRLGPQSLEPFHGPPRGFSFPREIQPILDRHCIRCHHDRDRAVPSVAAAAILPEAGRRALSPREARWRWTTTRPEANWTAPDFADAAWAEGTGGFGRPGTPGGKVGDQWLTPDIWLRRTFVLDADPASLRFALEVCHDEDVEVFVNGVQAMGAKGYITQYRLFPLAPEALAALRPGVNHLAVHCHQTVGGQYIDVALLAAPVPPPPPATAEPVAFSLRGDAYRTGTSKRQWSDAYLALTASVEDGEDWRGRSTELVNWISAKSPAEMLPPYSAGAARSRLPAMLAEGHRGVRLDRRELDLIRCWIDLLVPFCGDYTEANLWNDKDWERWRYFSAKREKALAEEQQAIAELLAP